MNKIEISGFEYLGSELSFRVNLHLWRESDDKDMPTKWTSVMPDRYISTLPQGTVLLFSRIDEEIKDAILFIAISPGSESIIDELGLTIKELENLIELGLLKFIDIKHVKEISITPSGTLVQDLNGWTFNHPIYLPKEIYITMGIQEYKNSGGKLGVGEKVSLSEVLLAYSKTKRRK